MRCGCDLEFWYGCYDGESLEQCKWIKLCGGRPGIDRSSSPYLQRSPMHLVVGLQPTFCMHLHNPPSPTYLSATVNTIRVFIVVVEPVDIAVDST